MNQSRFVLRAACVAMVILTAVSVPAAEPTTLPAALPDGYVAIRKPTYILAVPKDWRIITNLPPGYEAGFATSLKNGFAAIYIRVQSLPTGVPADVSGVQRQLRDAVVKAYPDATVVDTPALTANSRVWLDETFDLTEGGTLKCRRRYTYLYSESLHMTYVLMCNSARDDGQQAEEFFGPMRSTFTPAMAPKLPTEAMLKAANGGLGVLARGFPAAWQCHPQGAVMEKIGDNLPGNCLTVTVAFDRPDIALLYKDNKYTMESVASGKVTAGNDQAIPDEFRGLAPQDVNDFAQFMGRFWGYAYACGQRAQTPPQYLRVVVLDAKNQGVGSLTIACQDAAEMISNIRSLAEKEPQRLAAMFHYGPAIAKSARPITVVFVCDASASMQAKFDGLRAEMKKAVVAMRPTQSFALVVSQDGLAASAEPSPVAASADAKGAAVAYLDKVTTHGTSNPIAAMKLAFSMKPQLIFLLTDGHMPDEKAFLAEVQSLNSGTQVKVSAIGFLNRGDESEAVLKDLAAQNGGNFRYLSQEDQGGGK